MSGRYTKGNEVPRVNLFYALKRGVDEFKVRSLVNICINEAASASNPDIVADVLLMMMQCRDCRGGKGERDVCYKMMVIMYKHYPKTVTKLMEQLSEYGYYKDYFNLIESLHSRAGLEYVVFKNEILEFVIQQLRADEVALLADCPEKMSLCAKYAPTEGQKFDKSKGFGHSTVYDDLRRKMFPDSPKSRELYRKFIVQLRKALNITEILRHSKKQKVVHMSEQMINDHPHLDAVRFKLFAELEDAHRKEQCEKTEITHADFITKETKPSPTSYEIMRAALDNVRYDRVRVVLSESDEGLLVNYHFQPLTHDARAPTTSEI